MAVALDTVATPQHHIDIFERGEDQKSTPTATSWLGLQVGYRACLRCVHSRRCKDRVGACVLWLTWMLAPIPQCSGLSPKRLRPCKGIEADNLKVRCGQHDPTSARELQAALVGVRCSPHDDCVALGLWQVHAGPTTSHACPGAASTAMLRYLSLNIDV